MPKAKRDRWAAAIALAVFAGVAASPSLSEAKGVVAAPSPTVAAFLDLPSRYVDLLPAERRRLATTGGRRLLARDDRHGYLAIGGDGASPGFTVAIFRLAGAPPVVAVQRSDELRTRTWFLRRGGAGWEDVSAKLVPGYTPEGHYTLPRYGVTLMADGAPLQWRGGRFTPERAAAAKFPAAELPFVGRWKVMAVRVRPGKVQALQPDDPEYMGAVLDASPARLFWAVKPKGGTLDDMCQGPKLKAGAVACASGSFGPPQARMTTGPGVLRLDWYDGAQLELHKVSP